MKLDKIYYTIFQNQITHVNINLSQFIALYNLNYMMSVSRITTDVSELLYLLKDTRDVF
jgi:hypothetical protein